MKHFLNNGAQIELKPDTGWSWEGWDGKMEVRALKNTMKISGVDVIHENDVPAFILAPGKSYKAKGFDDTPGIIGTAKFIVDKETLDDKIRVNGFYALLISTTGKFTANVTMPSLNTKPAVPVPDILLIKTGTWKVIDTNQQIARRHGCSDALVPQMTHKDKMESAIHQSDISESVLNELGGVKGIVGSLSVGGGVLVALALIPGGAVVEAIGAGLLLLGAAISGVQIGEGINKVADFYKETESANTCNDLANAGKSFSDGIAKMGIGAANAALSFVAAKKVSQVKIATKGGDDLVGFRKDHILNRHKAGAGKLRTEFPSNWSDEKIINEINKIANNPNSQGGVGKWNSPYKTGTVDGIEIRVDFYPSTHPQYAGKVSTAYPINTTPKP